MISVAQAKGLLFENVPLGPKETLSLRKVKGCRLAEDLYAPLDSPPFNASAMDGFALCHQETPGRFKKVGTITAGEKGCQAIAAGECVEIMTGAMLPAGATAVVPYEEVEPEGDFIRVLDCVPKGRDVRWQGEQIHKGERALQKNTVLTAGVIGFLASLGILEVPVYRPPKIFILPTGSELVADFSEWSMGKIVESNSYALQAALQNLPVEITLSHPVPDLPKILSGVLDVALQHHDMVLICGGVSVGAHDYVKAVLERLKVQTLFWQVAQKPGKPLWFGKKGPALVFGLPGNPASTLVCCYEYVLPAILRWLGYPSANLEEGEAHLAKPYYKKPGRTHFVRALAEKKEGGWRVRPLEGEESHRMKSFAQANCLLVVPSELNYLAEGNPVTIHWLP